MRVSEIGFGAWAIGGNQHGNSYGPTEDKTSLEAVQRALELGCNFFDTADVYGFGHSEELLGRALRSCRDRVVIATKAGGNFYRGRGQQDFSPEYLRFAFEKSLERLKTDYIDIYQLHNPPLKLIEDAKTYALLKELKRDGRIRAWGVSIFDPVEGLAAIKVGNPDCIQVVYNIFTTKAADELFARAQQAACAIIAREPLANGFLTGKYAEDAQFPTGDIRHAWPRHYIAARCRAAKRLKTVADAASLSLAQFALKFVLSRPEVSVVIPGIKTPEQAEENLTASDGGPLSSEQLSLIASLAARNFDIA
ncbi:MAG TPA: aldo/keto reductase [Candidatus Obscuribacterales bacterium]